MIESVRAVPLFVQSMTTGQCDRHDEQGRNHNGRKHSYSTYSQAVLHTMHTWYTSTLLLGVQKHQLAHTYVTLLFRLGATLPPALLASLACSPCVLSSFLRSCCLFILFFFSSFPFSVSIWTSLFHPVFFLWVLCCLLAFGFCGDSFSIV